MKHVFFSLFLATIVLFGSGMLYFMQKNERNLLMSKIYNLEETILKLEEEKKNSSEKEEQNTHTQYIEESSVIDTVQSAKNSVVSIVQTKKLRVLKQKHSPYYDPFFHPFFSPEHEEELREIQTGGGSGFIYSKDGLVLTNKHVVDNESAEYSVVLHDGTEYEAKVLARDKIYDVAVLQILPQEGESLPEFTELKLGNSENIQVGQRVVAIGNALSEFQNTVTTGIVSGLNREIMPNRRERKIRNLIQTDAAINPGNSGGPLLTLDGKVIGINTAIVSGAEGIGFAIPSEDVEAIAKSVEKNGKIVRPFLGIRYISLNEEIAQKLEIDITAGALILEQKISGEYGVVPGSPAEEAGLQEGDIITKIDNITLSEKNPLDDIIAEKSPDDEISLEVYREKEFLELSAELEPVE